MKREKFYSILLTIAFVFFIVLNITFVSKVDPYEFGQLIAFLMVSVPILVIVIVASLIYEITHPIKKDINDLDDTKYEKKFKKIKMIAYVILTLSFATSVVYIWPSIIHHYFFFSLYIFSRLILIVFTILVIYLSNKKWRYVNILLWFIIVILSFMQFWKIGLISLNKNDIQGNIHYNRDQINKKLDLIKKTEALDTGNVDICFEQKDSDSQAHCVISLAEKKGDVNLCSVFNQENNKEYIKCNNERKNDTACGYFSNKYENFKKQCISKIAIKNNDPSLCFNLIESKLNDKNYIKDIIDNICLLPIAIGRRDESMCDSYYEYNRKYNLWLNNNDVNDGIEGKITDCKRQVNNGRSYYNIDYPSYK